MKCGFQQRNLDTPMCTLLIRLWSRKFFQVFEDYNTRFDGEDLERMVQDIAATLDPEEANDQTEEANDQTEEANGQRDEANGQRDD